MPCFRPLDAWEEPEKSSIHGKKKIYFRHRALHPKDSRISLACGQCIGCRMDRSKSWAIRCAHEAQYHEDNCFVTLTYETTPDDGGLQKSDFQNFMKRLRKSIEPKKIRFYMCGEYGAVYDQNGTKKPGWLGRPHYHAILFGHNFSDREFWKKSNGGQPMYRSETLEKLWTLGHSICQDFSIEAAAYIARYITKKMSGPLSEEHYKKIDPSTGELHSVDPEYTRMSLRPGLGKQWLIDHHKDLYPSDFITNQGEKFKAPRYYDALYSDIHKEILEDVKEKRATAAKENQDTPDRLATREKVQQIKSDKLMRDL